MKVSFQEIKDHELEYHFNEETPWVMEVIGHLDERMDRIKRPPNWKPRSRPTEVHFTLRRVEELIHVTGKVKTQLFLLCSLCADAFAFPIQLQFHTLLTQSQVYAEAPRETSRRNMDVDPDVQSFFESDDDDDDLDAPAMNLNSSDYEVTLVSEPIVDMKEILSEQIMLVLPMQPKPEKDDKGDCMKCGRSQTAFLPEEQTLLVENPFAVLKNFNKKKSDG